jgi:uncharacterized membrane protein YccC
LRRVRKRMDRDSNGSARVDVVETFLDVSADVLAQIGRSLSSSEKLGEMRGEATDRVQQKLHELEKLAESLRDEETNPVSTLLSAMTRDARYQMDALLGQLRSAVRSASENTAAGLEALASRDALQPWPRRITGKLATLRANLTLQSPAFRHAIRMALCLAIGEVVAHRFHGGRAYWLAMTIVLVLKQEFATTFSRGLLRIGGTILGLLLATGLFGFFPPGVVMKLALVGIFAFLLRWAGTANYGVFTIAISALIVVMAAFTGVNPKAVILARGEMTGLGGLIARARIWYGRHGNGPGLARCWRRCWWLIERTLTLSRKRTCNLMRAMRPNSIACVWRRGWRDRTWKLPPRGCGRNQVPGRSRSIC